MKRNHLFSRKLHRPTIASALLVAALSGLIVGQSIDWGPLDPALRALETSPALLRDRAAGPDHSLLSASDIERALPLPSRAEGLTVSTAS